MKEDLRQAVILAGGLGTRLGSLTKDCPKPILPVAGKPFLAYLIENISRFGISDFVICVGHLGESVVETLGDGSSLGVRISYSYEQEPLGTGGCVKYAMPLLDDHFLMLNGDTLFDFNFSDFLRRYSEQSDGGVFMALRRVEDVSRYGATEIEGSKISSFQDKTRNGPGWINGGVYCMARTAVQSFPNGKFSIENDYFPELAAAGNLYGVKYEGFFIDIGIPETLELAQLEIPDWEARPAVFLDRDGVINVNHGYVASPDRFDLVSGALEVVRHFNEKGYYVLVVTNQAGVARGYYSELEFRDFMKWIQVELRKAGAHIDGYYYSPNHPEGTMKRYAKPCFFRKPNPGMILRGLSEWPILKDKSFLIGDKASDIDAAKAAGIRGYLFEGENLKSFCSDQSLL